MPNLHYLSQILTFVFEPKIYFIKTFSLKALMWAIVGPIGRTTMKTLMEKSIYKYMFFKIQYNKWEFNF